MPYIDDARLLAHPFVVLVGADNSFVSVRPY
jgi:hypothetical protein